MLSEDEKAIQFYKRFIEAEEQELEWMYKEDEEYYRDSIEQKELLIKGWRNILNLITKLQKENKEKDKQIDLIAFNLADYVMYYEYDKCRNPEMIKQKAKELKQYFETKVKKGE